VRRTKRSSQQERDQIRRGPGCQGDIQAQLDGDDDGQVWRVVDDADDFLVGLSLGEI